MFFPTNNDYFDDSNNSKKFVNIVENNDCLICLEINDDSDNICIRIQNMFYTKDCLCDGWVHEYCLDVWYVKNKKCPICLSNMNKNQFIEQEQPNESSLEIINTTTHANIAFFNIKNLCLVMKFALLWLFIYNLICILSSILKLL
jgi:hypothetical protein